MQTHARHGAQRGGAAGRVSDEDDSEFVFGAGFELGYNWLLGAERLVPSGSVISVATANQ